MAAARNASRLRAPVMVLEWHHCPDTGMSLSFLRSLDLRESLGGNTCGPGSVEASLLQALLKALGVAALGVAEALAGFERGTPAWLPLGLEAPERALVGPAHPRTFHYLSSIQIT